MSQIQQMKQLENKDNNLKFNCEDNLYDGEVEGWKLYFLGYNVPSCNPL